jgi:hypothetical protein
MDKSQRDTVSRRQAVSLVGLGMAAAAAGPGLSQVNNVPTNNPAASEPNMQDPRTRYPKPPFKPQTQPWPGLARDM